MPKLPEFKKLVISGVLFLFLLTNFLFVFAPSASAQAIPAPPRATPKPTWYNQNFKDWYKKVYDSPENDVFGERYTAANVEWIIYGLFAFIINKFTGEPKATSCYMNNDLKNCLSYLKNALSFATPSSSEFAEKPQGILSFIFLQDRPLSGISYFRNVARNWHLIPEAKAQTPGFGFNALNPVLPLWRASRNVAYGLLVFAIIALSFMIMFRVKINPQTVITVQSAIPKVVFALILITFSYAISGFMVDLMYVVIGLISLILSQVYSGMGTLGNLISGVATPSSLFNLMISGPLGLGVGGALLIYIPLFMISALIAIFGTGGLIGLAIAAFPPAAIIGSILGLIFLIILAIVLAFVAIKTVWVLLKAFVSVVLLVAFAPLQIALGVVVPGIGFGTWLKSLIANLSVFPVAGTFIALSFLFLFMVANTVLAGITSGNPLDIVSKIVFGGTFTAIIQGAGGWPPLLGVFGSAGQGLIYLGVSLALLLMLPKVSDIIKALIEGKPFEYGTAIGEATGTARGLALAGLGQETLGIETRARSQNMSVLEYLGTIHPEERARYLAAAGLSRLLGGGSRK